MEQENNQAPAKKETLYAMVSLIPQDQFTEWAITARFASNLLDLNEQGRGVVIDHVRQREQSAGQKPAAQAGTNKPDVNEPDVNEPGLLGFLKETFTFPPIDKGCFHNEACMRAYNEQAMHIAIGMISPVTKLKWLGSGFITEGKFIGEGKDAIVHAVKGSADWVIKELKFGGAERAKMLEFYTNQLAADARFHVPELIHLNDGRLLQKFVSGSPTANIEFALGQLAAQEEACTLAAAARQALGIKVGQEYIEHGAYKVGVDPSYANFLFNEGKLSGWIDPLYSIHR